MRIAHFSDLHVLSIQGVPAHRFFNKRATGYANLRLKRGSIHRTAYVRSIAREIKRIGVDHVVITGDLTNLSLEPEFELAREILRTDLGLDPRDVTIVPGNHDVYTRGAHASRRFATYFADYLRSDLPDLAVDIGAGRFPVVKLRGPAAIIGLCSAVPRLPFVAAGRLGKLQIEALHRILEHPDVVRRTPIVAIHHPPHNPRSRLKTLLEGLSDAALLWSSIGHLPAGMVLHGHLHRRLLSDEQGGPGHLLTLGATSASLHHEGAGRMAGFNVYEIAESGSVGAMEAHVLCATVSATGESQERFDVQPLSDALHV
jgi:3',5'-cyclic AMP phosphodiesterase CpdA